MAWMIITHAMKTPPRLVGAALADRLRVMPAVVVTGARQTGKRTLAEVLVPGERHYRSLDDLDVLDAARRDPQVLVGGPGPMTLGEVQPEPSLLRAVKRAIDRDRALLADWLGQLIADAAGIRVVSGRSNNSGKSAQRVVVESRTRSSPVSAESSLNKCFLPYGGLCVPQPSRIIGAQVGTYCAPFVPRGEIDPRGSETGMPTPGVQVSEFSIAQQGA